MSVSVGVCECDKGPGCMDLEVRDNFRCPPSGISTFLFEMESHIGSDRVTTQARLAGPQASRDPPVSTPMLPSLGL